MKAPATAPRMNRSSIILTGVIGGLLSVALHELVHIVPHWGQITGVRLFPNFYTVAELIIDLPVGYDLDGEEFLAYTISAFVLIVTAIIISKIYDKSDRRSVSQILFPRRIQLAAPIKVIAKKPSITAVKSTKQTTSKTSARPTRP